MFSGSKARDHIHPISSLLPPDPRDREGRLIHFVWTPEEDQLLKNVIHQYGSNWALVADVFNNSRITIPTDRRSPWDCYQRWLGIRGDGGADDGLALASQPGMTPGGPRSGTVPMTPQSQIRAGLAGGPPGTVSNRKVSSQIAAARAAGGRRNMRHAILFDVMKKTAGKRAATKARQYFAPFTACTWPRYSRVLTASLSIKR